MMRIIATIPTIIHATYSEFNVSLIGSHDIGNNVFVHCSTSFTMSIPKGHTLHTILFGCTLHDKMSESGRC